MPKCTLKKFHESIFHKKNQQTLWWELCWNFHVHLNGPVRFRWVGVGWAPSGSVANLSMGEPVWLKWEESPPTRFWFNFFGLICFFGEKNMEIGKKKTSWFIFMVAILEPTFADVGNTSPTFNGMVADFSLMFFSNWFNGWSSSWPVYIYICTVYMLVIMPSKRLIVLTVKLCR